MDPERRYGARARVWTLRSICCGLVLGLGACVSLGRQEPPQQHYVLGGDTLRAPLTPSPGLADVTVGVRRLKLASYVASPFMVVRSGPNEIGFSEFHRWGEPLGAGINRVVAGGLSERGFRNVAVAPWPARERYDYLIQIDVTRFEGLAPADPTATEGGVHLLATWEIVRQEDGIVLVRGTTYYRRQGWTVGDYAGLVRMLDDGLDAIAADLTAGVVALRGG